MTTLYDIDVQTIDGKKISMAEFKDKVLLIVNTASLCGFTKQYDDLEKIYQDYKDQGLVVLGFPCNQFGNQEPGDESVIKDFCSTRFSITFPLFSKVEVNGDDTHPLFKYLKALAPGLLNSQMIKWNFTKFLVDKSGSKIERFAPTTSPLDLKGQIEKLIQDKK
jgi:glutathione peroxidase